MKRFTYFLLKIVLLPILGVHVYTQAQDLQECPETDPYNPGNRLVVIGDSFPSGYHDANEFPESQRWVYPSYIAERLGATYSVPELRIGMASGGITAPDIRSVFSPTGFVMSPYFGMFDLPPIDEKAHPGELHTNLAVAGARLSDAIEFDFTLSSCPPLSLGEFRCVSHIVKNTDPYSGLVTPSGAMPSQVDIAVYLKPKWVVIDIGSNDLSDLVDPVTFENNFRTMFNRLTQCNSEVQIIVANIGYASKLPGMVTVEEADHLVGVPVAGLIYPNAEPADRFDLYAAGGFLLGFLPAPPPLITVAEQATLATYKDAYNLALSALTKEFGAIYWDSDKNLQKVLTQGLKVSIDDTNYQLTSEYGGGLWSFQGTHVGKTLHAATANKVIKKINAKTKSKLPRVDVNAVACTDLHVRRALGLSEDPTEFTCPEVTFDPPEGDDSEEND